MERGINTSISSDLEVDRYVFGNIGSFRDNKGVTVEKRIIPRHAEGAHPIQPAQTRQSVVATLAALLCSMNRHTSSVSPHLDR